MGQRPFTGRAVVLDGKPLTHEGQLGEGAFLHRLANLALDQALPCRADLAAAFGVSSLRAHRFDRIASEAQWSSVPWRARVDESGARPQRRRASSAILGTDGIRTRRCRPARATA